MGPWELGTHTPVSSRWASAALSTSHTPVVILTSTRREKEQSWDPDGRTLPFPSPQNTGCLWPERECSTFMSEVEGSLHPPWGGGLSALITPPVGCMSRCWQGRAKGREAAPCRSAWPEWPSSSPRVSLAHLHEPRGPGEGSSASVKCLPAQGGKPEVLTDWSLALDSGGAMNFGA